MEFRTFWLVSKVQAKGLSEKRQDQQIGRAIRKMHEVMLDAKEQHQLLMDTEIFRINWGDEIEIGIEVKSTEEATDDRNKK